MGISGKAYIGSAKRAFDDGVATERAEWEALPLRSIKELNEKLADAEKMLEANRKEVSRLSEVVKTVAKDRDDWKLKFMAADVALKDLRAHPPKTPLDERTDRVVFAIEDMNKNLGRMLQDAQSSLDRIASRI
jgi:hypothetical protein